MARDLSKVGEREKLKVQREPYWQRLREGCFLGYRPSKRGGAGTWIARAYDEDSGKYQLKSLGDFGELPANKRFAVAKAEAEQHAELVEAGGVRTVKIETVADACRAYAKEKPEAEARFKRYLYDDPLAKVKLDKLRKRHVADWRKRLEETPALVSRSKNGDQRTRLRASSTVNRDMAVLRAALTKVLAPGAPNTDAAWQEALKAIPNADGRRDLYLDVEQRNSLLEAVCEESRSFVRLLCLLPLRPGAAASLTVRDFDRRTNELSIENDKNGKPRRFQISEEAASLLTEQSKSKLPASYLFVRGNGSPWDKDSWKKPIRAGAKAAGLPVSTTAYTLRHSVITDIVRKKLPLLTIAQISGTSVEMIERHYGHLVKDDAVETLNEIASELNRHSQSGES